MQVHPSLWLSTILDASDELLPLDRRVPVDTFPCCLQDYQEQIVNVQCCINKQSSNIILPYKQLCNFWIVQETSVLFPWDVIIEKGYFIIWSVIKLTADPPVVVTLFFGLC